jgi:hypothetical protein
MPSEEGMSRSDDREHEAAGPGEPESGPPVADPRVHAPSRISDLRARALLNDVDRRLSSVRLQIIITRWISLPVLVLALVAMVAGLVFGIGETGPVLGGAVSLAGAVAAFVFWSRRQDDYLTDLEEGRRALLHDHPALEPGGSPPTSESR